MAVEHGFEGQKFMEDMMPKVHWLRTQSPSLDIEVNGEIVPNTVHKCAEAHDMIVSGSAIMKSEDIKSVINLLRNVCSEATLKWSLDGQNLRNSVLLLTKPFISGKQGH
jgi:ribulose-phosphate 3-epimerase